MSQGKVNRKAIILVGIYYKKKRANCGLHPLIHTFAFGNSAQDVEKKKAEPKTPHFLSLNPRYCGHFSKRKVWI
jgi:hypothetical protein